MDERREIIARRDPERTRANDRARYYRNTEKRKALAKARRAANPEKVAETKRAWAQRNMDKRRAQWAANNAVRDGKLAPMPCEVCGTNENVQKHHDDYSKPLDVRWLCTAHHGLEHRMAA